VITDICIMPEYSTSIITSMLNIPGYENKFSSPFIFSLVCVPSMLPEKRRLNLNLSLDL